MKEDIDRWNTKFANRMVNEQPQPDTLLVETPWLPTAGSALDLASGSGQNAVHLALNGFTVTAVDGSENGMRLALQLAAQCGTSITPRVEDLDDFTTNERYDLVIVFYYLNRLLYKKLPLLLNPNGILIVKTFNLDFAIKKPGFDKNYMLNNHELITTFSQLEIIQHEESPIHSPGKSWVIAQNR